MSSTTSELEQPENLEIMDNVEDLNLEQEEAEAETETNEGEQTLQLGDVVLFHSPDNEIFDNNQFIIEYIDEDKVKLINTRDLQKRTLKINDGILGDGSIQGIDLIYRNSEKGYARQNGLLPDKWLNIYFGGEYPAIITGRISNLESDMIELTLPDNDVIYVNFAYKGLPEDLPIETIELREAPEPLKEVNVESEAEIEAEQIDELEGDDFEGTDDGSEDEETKRRRVLQIPIEQVKDQAREFILYADDIEFGEELGSIKQYVGVDSSKQRFNIEAQANDLLDELLSDVPSVERTSKVLNNIHIMIERFKQLRLAFSNFDDYGNVTSALTKDSQWKPLVKDLEKFKTSLYWLLPVAKNRKKLYDVKYDEAESENQTILALDLTDDLKAMDNIIKTYKSGSAGEEQSKYVTLMSELNPYLTPFEGVNPETLGEIIYEEEIGTNLNIIIDNLGDFYSSVVENDNIKTRRFLIQKYNLGMSRLEATSFKGSKMISHLVPLTKPDNLQLSSILTLPEPTIMFSQISLPASSIMQKANLNRNFLNYWQILKKSTNVENIMVDDLDKELEYEEDDYLSTIRNYVLAEKDKDLSSYDNYLKFLNVVIPKTRVLFNLVKKYIKGRLTLKDVVGYLEPFLIYTDDLTYMQYKEINEFLQQKMIDYKKSFVSKSRIFSLLKNVPYKQTSEPSSKIIKDLLGNNGVTKKEVLDSYSNMIMDEKLTNSELLLRLSLRDFGNLYNTAVSLENIVLMLPDNVGKFLEEQEEDAKRNIKSEEKDNTCKKYVIAKQYADIKDLESDNGKTIYYDKQFDKTNYGLLDNYEKEQIEMKPDEFEEFLKGKLITKHNYDLDEAPYIADALLNGMKTVVDGDLAIVYLDDESDYAYYGREGNNWVKVTDLTDDNIVSKDNNVLCNLQKDCIEVDKKMRTSCESLELNKAELSENVLKQMISAFDKKYKMSKQVQEEYINRRLSYFMDIMPSLDKIEKMRKYKYNKEQYDLGLNEEGEETQQIVSPYSGLRDSILGLGDFVKKQNDIVRFCKRFTRESTIEEEDADEASLYWLYCIKTNTRLMPYFYYALAKAYLISEEDYLDEMAHIIKNNGKLSDDGDMWVDKYSGYPIKMIDYDVEEGYETSGFKVKSRDLLEQDIGDNILKSSQQQLKKKTETKETRIISNVVTFLSGSMGINVGDKREFITKIVLDSLRVALTSEAEYKKKIEEMAKKGKKLPSYNDVYNLTILYLCLGAFLISAQISIPSIKTRKTYPGCVRSFDGYPIEGKTGDLSGITYLACIAEKSKSAIEPWTALKGSKMDKIRDKIMAFTDNYLLKHGDVIRKLEEKVEYLMSNPAGEQIPEEYNLMKWNNFLPPLMPFKIKSNILENVSPQFKKLLLEEFKSGSPSQREKLLVLQSKIIFFSLAIQEKIQRVVQQKTDKLLLTNAANEPFLENSCCNEKTERNTIQYFEAEQPEIIRCNEIVQSLTNILIDINAITEAPYLFSRENTKNIYPPLTDQYNEETIYLTFIKYCRFSTLIPMNEDLLPICADKPEPGFISNKDTLSDKIRKLKQAGRDYNNEGLLRLMQVVERNNILDINVNPIVTKPIQKIKDLLESISESNDEVVPKALIDNINGILDLEDVPVEEDSEEMRDLKNYLGRSNERLRENVISFIRENAKLSRPNIRNIKEVIDEFMVWESGKSRESEKEELAALPSQIKSKEKPISDNIKYNSIKFIKEFMRDMIAVFPNIILNKVDYASVKIQGYLKLSDNHARDISNSIRDYYAGLRPFYDDPKIVNVLNNVQTKCSNLLLLALETPSFTEINYNGKEIYNIFDKRTSTLLFENYLLQTFSVYINLANDENMINLELPESDSQFVDEGLVTTEEIELNEQKLEPIQQRTDIVISGNLSDLKERVAKLLIAFLNIMSEHKSLVDMSYDKIMDILFKTKEKEKDTFTDRLKALNDEEREVDTALKINKLGDWNKGLKKGLTQYVAEDYDDERDEMDKLAQVERSVRKNKRVVDENVDQYIEDYLEDERVEGEIDREDNDLSGLLGEGDDSDNEVDQDDQGESQWGGWQSYDD
jgi:hypothetical protein